MNDQQTRIAARLEEIERQHGRLTPALVVEDARDPTSPLHDKFTWDQAVAAEQHLLTQARLLIRSVRVSVLIDDVRVSAVKYVRDPHAAAKEQGYRSVVRIRTDREMAQATLLQELDRLDAVLMRVRRLAEVLNVANYATNVSNEVAALRGQIVGTEGEIAG